MKQQESGFVKRCFRIILNICKFSLLDYTYNFCLLTIMVPPGLLIIGDSQVKYGYLYVQNSQKFDISIISQSGMRVEKVTDSMLEATEFFNDVVVHLGTNNLICDLDSFI